MDSNAKVLVSSLDLNKVWERVSAKFSFNFGVATFNSWLKPLAIRDLDGGVITLKAPSRFLRDWVAANYIVHIEKLLREELPDIIGIDILVDTTRPVEIATDQHIEAAYSVSNDNTIKNSAFEDFESVLDSRFKFENFVEGASNSLAFNAAKGFADGRDVQGMNPLFIYGAVGSGKTHLLQSICWFIKENYPQKKAIYLSAERFMFQFVKALRERDTVSFKEYLRSADIFLIDDIQFICGKTNIQEEFVHTFNAIIENGKQVVLSANRAPSDFENIDERIKSRMSWGLVTDISKPDVALRFGILRSKARMIDAVISNNVLEFLAENINTNARELEGALKKIVAQSRLTGMEITTDFVTVVLRDLLRGVRKEISIEDIKRSVCDRFAIKISDLESDSRARSVARPRQVAMYLAKSLTTKSLPEIGRNFGSKNHTTVIHAIKTIEKLKTEDSEIEKNISEITRKLAG